MNIQVNLDFSNYIESKFSPKVYGLVGLVGRIVRNGDESYFSVVYTNNNWIRSEGRNVIIANPPMNYDYNKEGDILMLFYQRFN